MNNKETESFLIKYPKGESENSVRILRFLRKFKIELEKVTGIIDLPKDETKRKFLAKNGEFIDILQKIKDWGAELIPLNNTAETKTTTVKFKEETLFLMRFFQKQNKILKEKGVKFDISAEEKEYLRGINQKLKESD